MKKNLFLIVMMVWSCGVLLSQETWVKTFGGKRDDMCHSIVTTPDGGNVMTGSTESNDGVFMGMSKGGLDIFVIKLDSRGSVEWKKTIGGAGSDESMSITTSPDGGYVLTGATNSNDGDFKGMNKGGRDILVIKLDSRGDAEWKKTFGGTGGEEGNSITTSPDGGYILTGETNSNDDDFEGMNKGRDDIFVIKLDSRGDVEWKKTFGGTWDEQGSSITTTPDGGCVLTGEIESIDGDFERMRKGITDLFVIKLDSRGDVEWKKTFGGTGWEQSSSITTTPDGGCVLTGMTSSNDGDFNGMNKDEDDIFVIKLDSRGDLEWKKTFGGTGWESGCSITTTPDGGCVLTGETSSNDGDFNGMKKGQFDIFVIRLDSRGDVEWKKTFGGTWWEEGLSITTTPDGGCVLTGETTSNDGDFNMNSSRVINSDIFVMKLDSTGTLNSTTSVNDARSSSTQLVVYPNPYSSSSTITYILEVPSQIRIELMNTLGEITDVVFDGYSQAGTQSLPLNTTSITSGMYWIRMTTSTGAKTTQVSVVR